MEPPISESANSFAENNSDAIIRELPRIARDSRQQEEENYRFRDYLKLQLPMSNSELDGVVAQITHSVCAQIDCTTCANCCRTLQIVVDNRDIARLAKKRGMGRKEFTAQYVGLAEDGVQYFLSSPCAFLGDDNRCTVYEDRPQACRDFPYLDTPHFRSRSLSMVENTATCPIVFNVWERLKRQFRTPLRPARRNRKR
jgi:uncharacterized protein